MAIASKQSAQAPFSKPDRFFIGGNWIKPSSDEHIDVIAPATEELYVRVAAAQEADMNRAVAAARDAFDRGPWTRMSHRERAGYLSAMGKKLTERMEDVGQVWPNEMGVLHSIARAVAGSVGGVYEYYAGLADTFAFEERHHPEGGGKIGLLVREPVGVVAAIVPWNAPIITIAYKIAPALLAGCTVVLKASPEAPGTAYIMAEIAESVGLPAGVLNVVTSTAPYPSCWSAIPASTRSVSPVQPQQGGALLPFAASALPAAHWNSAANQRRSFLMTTISKPRRRTLSGRPAFFRARYAHR